MPGQVEAGERTSKAERFIQTFAPAYDSSDQRATFLSQFLHDYKFHLPPSPPSSLQAAQICGQRVEVRELGVALVEARDFAIRLPLRRLIF
jgi:hypothetical protein